MRISAFPFFLVALTLVSAVGGGDCDTPLEEQLLTAAKGGDITKVENLLLSNIHFIDKIQGGGDWGCGLEPGENPLLAATKKGHVEVCKTLLSHGADPDCGDQLGNRPAHYAAQAGKNDVLKLLQEYGSDLDIPNAKKKTPLFLSAANGQMESYGLLLEFGTNPCFLDDSGWTPAMIFSWKNNMHFIDYGFPQCQEDSNGFHLLFASRYAQTADIVQFAKKAEGVDFQDSNGRTALVWSALRGLDEAIDALILAGGTIDHVDDAGRSALLYAAERGAVSCVKRLIEAGANCSLTTGEQLDRNSLPIGTNDTALHLAALNGHREVFDILVASGADISTRNLLGYTAEEVLDLGKNPIPFRNISFRDDIPRVGQSNVNVVSPVCSKRVRPCFGDKQVTSYTYLILEAVIRKTGKVNGVVVLRGPKGIENQWVLESACSALKQWEFEPGKVDDVPADIRMTFKVDIHLQ